MPGRIAETALSFNREQARTQVNRRRSQVLCSLEIKCGSEPARDGGLSAAGDVACEVLIAGKPAPTGFSGEHKICVAPKSIVGASRQRAAFRR